MKKSVNPTCGTSYALLKGMDTTSPESGPSDPQEEKALAIWGALIGAVGGAIIFALVFAVPMMFFHWQYGRLLVIIGAIMGLIHGGGFGPAVALRMSQWWGRPPPNLPRSRL